jgi:hypothetical protein
VLAVASVPLMLGPVCLLADINFGRSSAVPLMLGPVCLLAYINFGRTSAVPLMLGPVCLLAYINFGRSLVVLLMLGPLCLLADINFGMSLAVAVDVWVSLPSGKFRTLNVYIIMDILTHVVFVIRRKTPIHQYQDHLMEVRMKPSPDLRHVYNSSLF